MRDERDAAVLGSWPRMPGTRHLLYDLAGDGREQANLARHHPALVAELSAEWDRIAADLLPYPPGHPGLPRHAAREAPAVGQAD